MTITISVCICTRNRPEELIKAIKSIHASSVAVHEIIVSDDSTDSRTEELIHYSFPNVVYIRGPRKGLCANRNNALTRVSGTHLMFMDDDVIMKEDFIERILAKLSNHKPSPTENIIVTGIELKNGVSVYPHDQSFFGYQRKPYQTDELMTVVINSTVFPKPLFNLIQFDEQLIYGYDEVDLTTRAIDRGYKIILCKDAVNSHYPSPENRDYYKPVKEASRIYVTYKRYLKTERLMLKAYIFIILASCHVILNKLKNEGFRGLKDAMSTLKMVQKYIINMKMKNA